MLHYVPREIVWILKVLTSLLQQSDPCSGGTAAACKETSVSAYAPPSVSAVLGPGVTNAHTVGGELLQVSCLLLVSVSSVVIFPF